MRPLKHCSQHNDQPQPEPSEPIERKFKKKDMADFVIDNRSYYEELYQEIERVLKVLKDETIYE